MELREEGLISLQDEIQQTSDILTITEATEIFADEPEVMQHSSRRQKRRFVEDYPGGNGYSQKSWMRVCGLLPKTPTLKSAIFANLFMT